MMDDFDTRVGGRQAIRNLAGAVAAAVVHDDDLVDGCEAVQVAAEVVNHPNQVVRLVVARQKDAQPRQAVGGLDASRLILPHRVAEP